MHWCIHVLKYTRANIHDIGIVEDQVHVLINDNIYANDRRVLFHTERRLAATSYHPLEKPGSCSKRFWKDRSTSLLWNSGESSTSTRVQHRRCSGSKTFARIRCLKPVAKIHKFMISRRIWYFVYDDGWWKTFENEMKYEKSSIHCFSHLHFKLSQNSIIKTNNI